MGHLGGHAAVAIAALLAASGCSGDDGSASTATTTTSAAPLVGDGTCDDPTGDVYKTGDPDATATGLAPGLDLITASASVEETELRLRFETVAALQVTDIGELILFGGRPEDAGRFEVRAVRGADGWAVRVVTFTAAEPTISGVTATVEAHGTVVEFTVPVGLLPPIGEFISFAYASTGMAGEVPVNDECFPFAGRTPVGS